MARNSLAIFLCIGLSQLAGAEDHQVSIRSSTDKLGASIESPIVGYFWSSKGLATIEGISNAAHARLLPQVDADRVVLPPGQTFEWQERAGQVYIASLPGTGLPENVAGAWSCADLVSFNSSATAAVLYRATGALQVIGGLPGIPRVVREIAAPQGAGDLTAVAISDDATTVLAASSTGLYAATGDGAWRAVMPGAALAIAFVTQKLDAIVALTDQIYLLKNTANAQWLAAANSPQAIATSVDGKLAVVLNAAGREALVVDLLTDAVTPLPLGAAAKDVQRGRDGTLIFIPPQGLSPWLLDTRTRVLSFAPELPGRKQGR